MAINYIFVRFYFYQGTILRYILFIEDLALLFPQLGSALAQQVLLQIHRNIVERSTTPLGLIQYLFGVIGLKHRVIDSVLGFTRDCDETFPLFEVGS
jgi:hypothetical protein